MTSEQAIELLAKIQQNIELNQYILGVEVVLLGAILGVAMVLIVARYIIDI